MNIRDFNPQPKTKIDKVNKILSENFGMKITEVPSKAKLDKIYEMSGVALNKLKSSSKYFQMHPEYAKYMGVQYVVKQMIQEGMYAESPAYMEMKNMLVSSVQELMDSGYTMDEAASECMNRYRMDNRFAYDDDHVKHIVLLAAKDYMESSCGTREAVEEVDIPQETNTELNEYLLKELAKECGVELEDTASLEAIEEKLNTFAEVSGKSRDAVVGFLNSLEEDKVESGIRYFGGQIAFENKKKDHDGDGDIDSDDYMAARDKAIKKAIAKQKDEPKESMFDDIINDLLSEEIEGTSVEEAEVVMAIRALADDIQDQVERLGRMKNEDIPAITDQMVAEVGLDRAQQFKDSAESLIDQTLSSAKSGKEGIDSLVAGLTGIGSDNMGLGDTSDIMSEPEPESSIDDLDAEPEVDVNEPAAAGPEDEPLGRAPIEV